MLVKALKKSCNLKTAATTTTKMTIKAKTEDPIAY